MDELNNLPDVRFVETDAQQVISDIISGYEAVSGRTLATADPVRLFLLSLAYVIIQQRQQIDAAGKSNLLRYAVGDFLDHLGAMRDTPRRQAVRARTLLKFTLSAVQSSAVGIPQGTRATHDRERYWRTIAPVQISAGQVSVTVAAEAIEGGAAANGLAVGQITTLVDPIAFVQQVENTTATSGGLDREDDETYRARIYEAPAAFSIAGPSEAYEFWAYAASPAISHVRADNPEPGVARVCVLMQDGQLPDAGILQAVEAELSPATRRPLADSVEVIAPEPVLYDLEFTYYIRRADQGSQAQIAARVAAAVGDYLAWQRAKIGRDINPDELTARVKAAGAKRLVIASPDFTVVSAVEVAQEDGLAINYGGVEDE